MPPRIKPKTESIKKYLTRANSKKEVVGENIADASTGPPNPVQAQKMANTSVTSGDDVSNAELRKMLIDMDAKRSMEFENIHEKMGTLSETVEGIEFELKTVQEAQAENKQEMKTFRHEIDDVKEQLLTMQVHNRKNNLLIQGIEGHETTAEEAIQTVRKFGKESLELGEEFVDNMMIRNAHRLQPRKFGPSPIIVVFLKWTEREAFLKAGKKLQGTKLSIRTDLPRELKNNRGDLLKHGYEMRKDNEDYQTRIREKGIHVWLDWRKNSGDFWKRIDHSPSMSRFNQQNDNR